MESLINDGLVVIDKGDIAVITKAGEWVLYKLVNDFDSLIEAAS